MQSQAMYFVDLVLVNLMEILLVFHLQRQDDLQTKVNHSKVKRGNCALILSRTRELVSESYACSGQKLNKKRSLHLIGKR